MTSLTNAPLVEIFNWINSFSRVISSSSPIVITAKELVLSRFCFVESDYHFWRRLAFCWTPGSEQRSFGAISLMIRSKYPPPEFLGYSQKRENRWEYAAKRNHTCAWFFIQYTYLQTWITSGGYLFYFIINCSLDESNKGWGFNNGLFILVKLNSYKHGWSFKSMISTDHFGFFPWGNHLPCFLTALGKSCLNS